LNQCIVFVFSAFKNLPGLSGLFVAGIFSGGLSSVSSTLNSLAAVTLEDYFKPLYFKIKKTHWKNTSASVSKIIAFVYGLICIGGGYFAENLGGIMQSAVMLFGVVGGPLLGLFTMGMATEVANQWGVIPGTLIGIGVSLWIGFSPKPSGYRQLEYSIEDCSEFGGILKNSTVTEASDDKK
jgi:solute carrier family 5 (sodium-coupled monocarboxylate transporter), member 8/12